MVDTRSQYASGKLITRKDKRTFESLVAYILCVWVCLSEFEYVHASFNFRGMNARNTYNKIHNNVSPSKASVAKTSGN